MMMNRIFLLRHARAAWPGPGMRDFDRPLHERGREDARKLGREMASRGWEPAAILCSPATRAKQTQQIVCAELSSVPVEYNGQLYHEDATVYLNAIKTAASLPLLIIGHNPMLEDIAHAMFNGAATEDSGPFSMMETGYPTCGLAVFDLQGEPGNLDANAATLSDFLVPGRF